MVDLQDVKTEGEIEGTLSECDYCGGEIVSTANGESLVCLGVCGRYYNAEA